MVPFQDDFLQTVKLDLLILWTFFNNGSLDFVFPPFPVGLFLLFLSCLNGGLLLLFLFGFGVWLVLSLHLGWCELSPVLVHLADTTNVGLVFVSSKSLGAINTNEGGGSASSHYVLIALFLFQSDVAIFANKSDHFFLVEML